MARFAVGTMVIPYVNVTGLQGFSNWGPGNFTQQTLGWRDMMTATIKTHTLKVGFEQFNIRENDQQSGAFSRPTYNFNNLLDFMQGEALTESATPVSLATHEQAPYERRYRGLYTGVFAQDSWKVTPRLTFNAGVRFDLMSNFFAILSPQLTNTPLDQVTPMTSKSPTGYCPVLEQSRSEPQYLGLRPAHRICLGRFRLWQDGVARGRRNVLRPTALPSHYGHYGGQSPEFLYTISGCSAGNAARLPVLQPSIGFHGSLSHRGHKQCRTELRWRSRGPKSESWCLYFQLQAHPRRELDSQRTAKCRITWPLN